MNGGLQNQSIPPGFLQDACPQTRQPALYWQYKHALKVFVASLPTALQNPLQLHPYRQHCEVHEITLVRPFSKQWTKHGNSTWCRDSPQHLYIAIAELWLEDRDEEDAENTAALQVARRMVVLARAMPDGDLHRADIYVCMLLIWAGRVLIKELKRLSVLVGDLLGKFSDSGPLHGSVSRNGLAACASVEYDLDSLVYIIGRLGKDLKLA